MHASIIRNASGLETTYKQLEQKSLVATETDNTQRLAINSNSITVPPKNANDFVSINGTNSGVGLYGTGRVTSSVGNSGSVTASNSQTIRSYMAGQLGTSTINTSGSITNVYGMFGRIFFYSPIGAKVATAAGGFFQTRMPNNDNSLIQNYYGNQISITQDSQNTGTAIRIAGLYNEVLQAGKTKYPNMYGIYTSSTVGATATAPDNHYGLYINNVRGGALNNYAIYTEVGKVRLGDNTMVKTDIDAPASTFTVNGWTSSMGINDSNINRSIFIGALHQKIIPGTYIGFGVYADNTDYQLKASKDNHIRKNNKFVMVNDIVGGKFYFSPFIMTNGSQVESFDAKMEAAMTISHSGKKVGIGTNDPVQKLDVAGSIKVASTDNTCDATKAGTIRFVAETKKFQGCTGDSWVDLH